MNGQPNPYAHLGPYEKAARIYLQREGQDPDAQIQVPHSVIAGTATSTPVWHFVAEQMFDLSKMLSAMKAAQKEDGPKIEVAR